LVVAQKQDGSAFEAFYITATLTDAGTYDTFAISPAGNFGTIANNDIVYLHFYRTGDLGATGANGTNGTNGTNGSSGGFNYLFNSTTTTGVNPGTNKFFFNNITFASASVFGINKFNSNSDSINTLLTTIDDGTSANKCLVLIVKPDGTGFYSFYITAALTNFTNHVEYPITPITAGGGVSNGDLMTVLFIPVGNIGSTGSAGPTGPGYTATSTTSLLIAVASKSFTTQAGLAYTAGARARASSAANTGNFMEGLVSSYSSTTLVIAVDLIGGSGTLADWNINLAGQPGANSNVPQNVQSGTYAFVLTDAGKQIFHDSGSAHTYTIPANGSVAFNIGDIITIVNNTGGGNITLAITTDTLRRGDGTAGTGSRTIGPDSVAVIMKTKSTEWMIVGTFT